MAAAEASASARRRTDGPGIRVLHGRLRARRDITVSVDGEERRIAKGDLLSPGDPLGVLVPDGFEKVEVPIRAEA